MRKVLEWGIGILIFLSAVAYIPGQSFAEVQHYLRGGNVKLFTKFRQWYLRYFRWYDNLRYYLAQDENGREKLRHGL